MASQNWWCVVFKDIKTGKERVVTSDNAGLVLNTIRQNTLLIGFNIKRYDMLILSAIVKGATPQEVHKLSGKIIGENGKNTIGQVDYYNKFSFQDLMDDWNAGGLKVFESNFGLQVLECPIKFSKQHLTDEDKQTIIDYC